MKRVYIDNFEARHIWSVDDGPGTVETRWDEVRIRVPGITRTDLTKRGSKTEPCCWIECDGVLRQVAPSMAVIQ